MLKNKKGFSLVELVVVIAIMAVLTAVLTASIMVYMKKSRMQRDDSAMNELVNAVRLALTDADVYDECLPFVADNNNSCYALMKNFSFPYSREQLGDSNKKLPWSDQQWMYGDDARIGDESVYHLTGQMRGFTLTFAAAHDSNRTYIDVGNGKVNWAYQLSTGKYATNTQGLTRARNTAPATSDFIYGPPDHSVFGNISSMFQNQYLYSFLRSTVGDKIELVSQTYRNSDYTIFIHMGSTGGNQSSAQDAVIVWGQWNGTNIPANYQ